MRIHRKKLLLLLVLFLILGIAGFFAWSKFFCSDCKAAEKNEPALGKPRLSISLDSGTQIGSPAPYFVLEDLNGKTVSLDDLKGKNILLVFWLTSCGWCEKERPDLVKFTEEQKGRTEVLAVSWESKETLRGYIKEKQINFTLLLDSEGKTQAKYLALGTPNHFLIDRKGEIVATKPGYASYADLMMLAQSLEE